MLSAFTPQFLKRYYFLFIITFLSNVTFGQNKPQTSTIDSAGVFLEYSSYEAATLDPEDVQFLQQFAGQMDTFWKPVALFPDRGTKYHHQLLKSVQKHLNISLREGLQSVAASQYADEAAQDFNLWVLRYKSDDEALRVASALWNRPHDLPEYAPHFAWSFVQKGTCVYFYFSKSLNIEADEFEAFNQQIQSMTALPTVMAEAEILKVERIGLQDGGNAWLLVCKIKEDLLSIAKPGQIVAFKYLQESVTNDAGMVYFEPIEFKAGQSVSIRLDNSRLSTANYEGRQYFVRQLYKAGLNTITVIEE